MERGGYVSLNKKKKEGKRASGARKSNWTAFRVRSLDFVVSQEGISAETERKIDLPLTPIKFQKEGRISSISCAGRNFLPTTRGANWRTMLRRLRVAFLLTFGRKKKNKVPHVRCLICSGTSLGIMDGRRREEKILPTAGGRDKKECRGLRVPSLGSFYSYPARRLLRIKEGVEGRCPTPPTFVAYKRKGPNRTRTFYL